MAADLKEEKTVAVPLRALLGAGEGAVVTLVAGDTQVVAHRAVLAARSPVFAAMFAHDTLEASSGQVTIPDVEGPVLCDLVAYLYSQQAPQPADSATQLLAAADKYGVSGLEAECERLVATQLTVENAAAAAVLAVRHHCPDLERAAVAFIKSHNYQVMATQGWADAVLNWPEDVQEINRLLTEPSAETSRPTADAQRQPRGDGGSTPNATALLQPTSERTTSSCTENLSVEQKGQRLIDRAMEGAVDEMRKLLAAGADVGARDCCNGRTALHYAALGGHDRAVKFLLERGAEVDAKDDKLDTPLHLAAYWGRSLVVRLLLAYSANPNIRDHQGYFPLHWAALDGKGDMITELLDAGADRWAKDSDGQIPLNVVPSKYYHIEHLLR